MKYRQPEAREGLTGNDNLIFRVWELEQAALILRRY